MLMFKMVGFVIQPILHAKQRFRATTGARHGFLLITSLLELSPLTLHFERMKSSRIISIYLSPAAILSCPEVGTFALDFVLRSLQRWRASQALYWLMNSSC